MREALHEEHDRRLQLNRAQQGRGAARLRGTPAATDGPYPESAEVLGGFYVVEAPDRAQAVSYVEGLAELKHDHSWVEVWPLVDA